MAAQLRLIEFHLNSAEEKRLCRSPCSLFWARSLLCWEILFQEANRIWHPEPIFSNSHLAAWSAGSTTASDNTSLLDKFFLFVFFIYFLSLYLHIEDLSVFPPLFMKGFDSEWGCGRRSMSVCLPLHPFLSWRHLTFAHLGLFLTPIVSACA